jgi:hypothetical protein
VTGVTARECGRRPTSSVAPDGRCFPLAALALWRLVHRWAPRRPVLAFTVAIGYLYLVAGSDAAPG